MLTADTFRRRLREHLEDHEHKVLLRIVVSNTVHELTGRGILDQAAVLVHRYCSAPRSGVVLLLLPHSIELFLLHLGLILDGRIPAILAWPTTRVDPEKYQRNLLHQLRSLPASQLVTLPRLAENMASALGYPVVACPIESAVLLEKAFSLPAPLRDGGTIPPRRSSQTNPGDAVFLQFSGGTTGAQKAVVVTADMLERQLRRLADFLPFTANDVVVSWLPMYHDMGLIACLWMPLWCGASSVHFSASDWLVNPELLFDYMERYAGTFCWLPNFAFSYLPAQKARMTRAFALDRVRGWISCSEPVRHSSMELFVDAFHEWGVRAEQLQASYAMAENVFAVTQTRIGSRPATFQRRALSHGGAGSDELAFGLLDDTYVSSGGVLPGMELRVMDRGCACKPGQPGELELRSECLFSGYWGNDGFVTDAMSADGWYATGDFGFMAGDDVFVIGRKKDIVIIGGQNVFPEDVEAVVNTLEGIYAGRVVAFGVSDDEFGTETLAVVAELRGEYDRARAATVQREIQRLILSTIGLAPRFVSVVPERWIVKSTAGKISRRETRLRWLEERENRASIPVVAARR